MVKKLNYFTLMEMEEVNKFNSKFELYTDEVIPQALFHVEHTDLDDKTGAPLDDVIILDILHSNKDLLKVKDLRWFMETYGFLN